MLQTWTSVKDADLVDVNFREVDQAVANFKEEELVVANSKAAKILEFCQSKEEWTSVVVNRILRQVSVVWRSWSR